MRRLHAHVVPAALFALLFCCASFAAENAAILMHGKWGTPDAQTRSLRVALERAGYAVVSPEMPWSRGRGYDVGVDGAAAEIDAHIAKLEAQGAKRVFLIGHSLGAAFALHYGSRKPVAGIVAIAPGHRPEGKVVADMMRPDVTSARELVAAGKSSEIIAFTDFNSGDRRARMTATAASFLSYFDPAGSLNMTKNAASVQAAVPVLWIVPLREDPRPRPGLIALFRQLPSHPETRLAEPDADHLNAPNASISLILDWMRGVGAKP